MVRSYLIDLKDKGNFSWSELSNLSGLPDATIRKVFSGETADPRLDTVVKLVTAMGGSLDELVEIKKNDSNNISNINLDAIDAVKNVYEARIAEIKSYSNEHIISLNRDKKSLRITTSILAVVLVLVLVIDLFYGSAGWVRY